MHSYLPSLLEGNDNQLAKPAQAGVWNDDQGTRRLKQLADAIKVPPGTTRIHSIPDPWARAILFDRALFDPKHTLHREIMGEWRGLLAIFGLRERRRFNGLRVVPVELNAAEFKRGLFSSVIARIVPSDDDLIAKDTSWAKFHILRWQKQNSPNAQAFAFTSPTTLVATGVYYQGMLGQDEVPWFDGRLLVDPVGHISMLERTALAEWILWLRSKLSAGDVTDSVRREKLLPYLLRYAQDLDPNATERGDEAVLGETELNLHGGIFALLNKAHKPEEQVITDVEIVTSLPAGGTRYVLIDASLGNQLKRPEREILVHPSETLSTALLRVAGQRKSSEAYARAGKAGEITWCTPAFFFQGDLIYERNEMAEGSKDAEAFPGCRDIKVFGNADHRRILLPLTEAAARLFTPDYLERNFSIEWLSREEARCRLRLQVRSVANQKQFRAGGDTNAEAPSEAQGGAIHEITIERTYFKENKSAKPGEELREPHGMIRIQNLPALCIWPDFAFADQVKESKRTDSKQPEFDNRWKKYFLFEAWRSAEMAKEFIVRPLGASEADGRQITQGSSVFQIYSMTRFPSMLVCQMPFVEGRPRHSDQSPPKGLLLLREPEKPSFTRGRAAALGVDFGTTGTSIYRAFDINNNRGEREDIAQMSFEDRLVRVTGYDRNALEHLTRDLFIPGREWSAGKILSVFQDFGRPANRNGQQERGARMPLRDGHVLFSNESRPADFITGDPGSIRSDLKWGDERQSDAARGFLAQLCMQSVAELVHDGAESIDVRYSYPTAFSDYDLENWKAIWARVIEDDVRAATSVKIEATGAEQDQVDNREAVAATRFFSHEKNLQRLNITRGALTLDIGGGTTDLAVWNRDPDTHEPTLMAHLSVLFAGRDIFLAPILRRPKILTEIHDEIALQTLSDKSGDAHKAQLDAIISAYGEAMLAQLPFKSHNDTVVEFLSILELGLCGIAFYSGLLVGRLVQTGAYQPGTRIPVFVGGNGSKLLQWCALGRFSNQAQIHKKFALCLTEGAKIAAPSLAGMPVQIVLSDFPKEEVAFGLVARATRLSVSDDYTNPLAGESFHVIHKGQKGADEIKEWNESPDPESLRADIVKVNRQMPIFTTFLKTMNPRMTSEAIEEEVDDISGFVDSTFIEMAHALAQDQGRNGHGGGPDPMRREPIFIMALKRLLEKKTNDWASHG